MFLEPCANEKSQSFLHQVPSDVIAQAVSGECFVQEGSAVLLLLEFDSPRMAYSTLQLDLVVVAGGVEESALFEVES